MREASDAPAGDAASEFEFMEGEHTMAQEAALRAKNEPENRKAMPVFDVDIHESFAALDDLVPHLDEPWKGLVGRGEWKGFTQPFVYWTSGGSYWTPERADGEAPSNMQTSASDYGVMKDLLLDAFDIERGILTGYFYPVMLGEMQVEFASALAAAYNDFQVERWLSKDDRFLGSIHVAPQDPQGAAREIDRLGSHPQMVQVMLALGGLKRAYGDPFFLPIFEAAQRNNLAIATHHNTYAEGALGMGRYYVERHVLIPQVTMATLISLVFNGVFDRFADLRFILLEGGFTWLPHLLWRMDREYKSLRQEVPWVKKLPSEHIVGDGRVKLATQPTEDLSAEEWTKVVELIGSDEALVFATDYPHFDFDSPTRALPNALPEDLKRKILYDNARAFYGF